MKDEKGKLKMEKGKRKDSRQYRQELLDRLLRFGVKIILLANTLPMTPAGYAIAGQIIRSATSIGANCEEAQDAFSRKDFLKSLTISLKEAKETRYWLKIIEQSRLLTSTAIAAEVRECNEIIGILTASVRTVKRDS